MKLIFYITQFNQVKDATKIYLEIISEALTGSPNLQIVTNVKKVKNTDFVVTFTVTDFLRLKLRKPKVKTIHWFQGVIPEEAYLKTNNKKQYYVFNLLERFTLKYSSFNFFVSEAMKNHYKKKYTYKKKNYFIMPCFNGVLQHKEIFLEKNCTNPKFVYIGSMANWQCVDKVLQIFKIVKSKVPEANLTLLTGQQEKAKQLCLEHQVNANIKYVALKEINTELLNYKYGFLVRENITVNKVSTPTKMSTYMASGVIPIYSDVIEAFSNLGTLKYSIKTKNIDTESVAKKIIEFENIPIDNEDLYREYHKVFNTYYSKKTYINQIKEIFNT